MPCGGSEFSNGSTQTQTESGNKRARGNLRCPERLYRLEDNSHTHRLPNCLHLVLSDQSNHRMWCNPEVVSRETSPQASDAALLYLLHSTINWSFEWRFTSDWIR